MPTTQSLGADKQTQPGIERRIDAGIAYLLLDLPDSKLNKLTGAVMAELERQLEALRADASVQAIVLASAKADSFVAGADIDEIEALQSAAKRPQRHASASASSRRSSRCRNRWWPQCMASAWAAAARWCSPAIIAS